MATTRMTATGDASYEGGGGGGKFQKRPFRRAPTTPYDRPASAARVNALARPAESQPGDGARGSRWLSKIVDPASRIVAQGASRLFSSFFRKRLTAPTDASELNVKSREEVSNASHVIQNSASEVKERNHIYENNAVNSHVSDGALQETGSHVGQTFELEQLLKQKTFTRFEFDHLMELLSSRTVEPSTSKPPFSSQEIERPKILEQGNVKHQFLIDRKISESLPTHDNKDKESPGPELEISFGLHADNTTPVGSLVLKDENLGRQAGSPAEIAKAYMGSRPSNRSPGILSVQNQVFEEDRNLYNNSPYSKKPFDHSVASTFISTSATPGLAKSSRMTPRILGKSATYRMSQSPYFKFPLATKARSPPVDQYVWSSSSEWASTGGVKSDDRQSRKRGRSVLDDDTSSFGPVRRLRQKSSMMLPSRYSNSSLKYLSSPLTSSHSYKFPNQNPLNLDDQSQSVIRLNDAENSAVASTSIVPIPPQSSEMARRILDQLDKLKSSPKGKSSKFKPNGEEESPSKLTYNMLHERALRSMEDIDSSKFLSVHGNNQIELTSDAYHEVPRSSSDQKQDALKENGLLDPSVLGVQVTAEAKPANLVMDVKSNTSGLAVSNGSSSAQKKPSFCISIPEDSLDFDDDDYTTKDSGPAVIEDGQHEVLSQHESTHSERGKLIKVVEASKIIPVHTSLQKTKNDHESEVFDKHDIPEKNGLMFSTAPTSNNLSKVLPATNTTVLSESPAPLKVESGASKLGLDLKQTHKSSSPSVTDDFNGFAGVNSVGSASASVTLLGDLNSDKGDNKVMGGESLKLFENAAVPIFSSPASSSLSTFAVSATSTMPSGTPSLSSGTSSASIVSAKANSGTAVKSDLFTSTTMASSTSSSALTTGYTMPTFQFGSGHPIATPSSATENVISDSSKAEGESVKLSAFGTSNSIISGISSTFPDAGGNSSGFTSSSSSVSSITSSSMSAAPLFGLSSDTGSSMVSAASGSKNSFFSFGASSQSSGVNISSSQSTSTSFGFAAGATSSNQGTQSAGDSHVFQSSVNQFGSLSSPTIFGANGSSSSGSSSSLFSSPTFAAKSPGSGPFVTFSTVAASSSSSASSTSFTPSTFISSSGFSFTAPLSSPASFASTTSFTSSSSSSFSFSTGVGVGPSSGSGSSTSFAANLTNITFNSSSQASPSTIFGSSSSSMSSPSTGFSLGSSTSSGSSPFTFGASSVPTFSFGATGTALSSMPLPSKPVFGVSNQLPPMNSGSPGNDQMNVEDSMADDPVRAPASTIPTFGTTFGQPASAPAAPSFVFGSPVVNATPSTFQFGGQHGTSVPQNTSPFQPTGSLEFAAGGSFSLGSGAGGGDKSGRKFVRVRRDKLRKK